MSLSYNQHNTAERKGQILKEIICLYLNQTLDINLSLFEIRVTQPEVEPKAAANQYILLMGHVLKPSLYLSTARFRNAILAPPGMMYVGEPVTSKAILNNRGMVQTYFRWGNPFGCHSRKIKVSISPNYGEISSGHKISLKIIITPLDEVSNFLT